MNPDDVKQTSEDGELRRKFLKKLGAAALYTPPTIILLMQPSREALASGGSGRGQGRGNGRGQGRARGHGHGRRGR